MRSSYYSDRRFKRSSLAHELCSKIEVTPGPGLRSQRELPPNLYFSFIPLHCLSLLFARSPILIPSRLDPSSFPANAMIPPSRSLQRDRGISPSPLSLLLFRRYIFSSHRERSVGPSVARLLRGLPHRSFIYLSSVLLRNGAHPPPRGSPPPATIVLLGNS